MQVVCLQEEAFYALFQKVIEHVEGKRPLSTKNGPNNKRYWIYNRIYSILKRKISEVDELPSWSFVFTRHS